MNIPIIASLNGVSTGGWIKYAMEMEQAGADALELNIFYLANDPKLSGEQVEEMYTSLVSHVKASVRIPVAVKLGPYFSAMANMAKKLDHAGADALVLFNRFYQPDFDLEALDVKPSLSLSTPNELLLRLHWVATLYGQVKADMAITGGVHTAQDVLKAMMAGAKVAMMTSGHSEERHRAHGDDAGRPARLDGGARVRIHPPDAGQHEPEVGGRPDRLQPRQLPEGPQLLLGPLGGAVTLQFDTRRGRACRGPFVFLGVAACGALKSGVMSRQSEPNRPCARCGHESAGYLAYVRCVTSA